MRETRRQQCAENLPQLVLGIHNLSADHKYL
ncbi:DUF1559 domain-containing protein [Enterococcus sp. AD013-P3]